MSLRSQKKEQGESRFLYLLAVPWEIVLPALGLIIVLVIILLRGLGIDVF